MKHQEPNLCKKKAGEPRDRWTPVCARVDGHAGECTAVIKLAKALDAEAAVTIDDADGDPDGDE